MSPITLLLDFVCFMKYLVLKIRLLLEARTAEHLSLPWLAIYNGEGLQAHIYLKGDTYLKLT